MEDFKTKVHQFMQLHGISQADIARATGYTPGVISGVIKGSYAGDFAAVQRKVLLYIQNYTHSSLNEDIFVPTKQTRLMHLVYKNAIKDRRMAVIHGPAGMGKTKQAKRIALEYPNAIYLEVVKGQRTRDVLREIVAQLKTTPKRSNMETFEEVCAVLHESDRFIIIDQAEFLRNDTIEVIRAIWDRTGTTIVLVGIDTVLDVLREHQHLYSRIKWRWNVQKLTHEDVQQLLEVHGVADAKLAPIVHRLAHGNWRSVTYLVENAIEIAGQAPIDERILAMAKEMLLL